MTPRHLPYKRWRSCLASHNLSAPTPGAPCKQSYPSSPFADNCDNLASFISAVRSTDLVFRTEALHQLSLFLLYLSPSLETSFSCPDAFAISFCFKNKEILIPVKDIEALYRILFSELAGYTDWLFRSNSVKLQVDGKTFSDPSGDLCDGVHLMLLVELLRCCIRILPFLEFNTSLSLVAAEILGSVLRQLCCPTSLRVLVSRRFNGVAYSQKEQFKAAHDFNGVRFRGPPEARHVNCNPSMSHVGLFETSIKNLQNQFLSHENVGSFSLNRFGNDSTSCCLHNARKQSDKLQIAAALLEVFMDELLLEPGLVDSFLASSPDAVLESSNDGLSSTKYVQMVIEAAAAHFILSISCWNYFEMLHGRFHGTYSNYLGLGMSLPAAVTLLDLLVVDGVHIPDLFLSHIIRSLMMSFSYPSCLMPQLPGAMVLGLVASLLETAVNLYFKMWTNCSLPSHYYEYSSLQDRFWALSNGEIASSSVLQLLFDEKIHIQSGEPIVDVCYETNITTCQDRDLETPSYAHSICCDSWRGASYNNFQGQDQVLHVFDQCSTRTSSTCLSSNATALTSVLQLISSSLLYMITEVKKGDLLSTDVGTSLDRGCIPVDAELFIDYAKDSFKMCIPENGKETWKDLDLDFRLQKLSNEVDESIGNVFLFFLEKLHWSLKRNAPESLCKGYLNVIKSLMTLIRFIDERRNDIQLNDTIGNEPVDSLDDKGKVLDETKDEKGEVFVDCREENGNTLLNDQYDIREGVMPSTLAMTRTYQRRWQRIISRKDASTRQKDRKCSMENTASSPSTPNISKGCEMKVQDISNDGNAYIQEMLVREGKVDGECFDDLSDFIVCKAGRDYSSWMKSHCKKRKKMLQKTYWKRLKAKRALVSLLASKSQHVSI